MYECLLVFFKYAFVGFFPRAFDFLRRRMKLKRVGNLTVDRDLIHTKALEVAWDY